MYHLHTHLINFLFFSFFCKDTVFFTSELLCSHLVSRGHKTSEDIWGYDLSKCLFLYKYLQRNRHNDMTHWSMHHVCLRLKSIKVIHWHSTEDKGEKEEEEGVEWKERERENRDEKKKEKRKGEEEEGTGNSWLIRTHVFE